MRFKFLAVLTLVQCTSQICADPPVEGWAGAPKVGLQPKPHDDKLARGADRATRSSDSRPFGRIKSARRRRCVRRDRVRPACENLRPDRRVSGRRPGATMAAGRGRRHRRTRGQSRDRIHDSGRPQKYSVSAPVALGTIQELPRPLMSRSIAIRMRRSPNQLKPFDETDRAFMIVREAIQKWGARCNLNHNPAMPVGLRGRTADNWRPLLAIADDLGFGYGEAARAAAVVLSSDRQYENQHVTLLTDIRTVFDRFKRDRLRTKAELIPALAGLEDSLWGEWTGVDGTAAPHVLSQGDIGRLLRPFGIRSKTVWPPGRRQHTKSDAGSYRWQFEQHGPAIANQAPHRHRQAKLGTCRGREPPHARHTCLGQPSTTGAGGQSV
jgi:hypothetical protein